MSLRARIALLVGVTVLIATAIAGVGTAITTRNVGRDRLDQELTTDASRFSATGAQLGNQLQFAFQLRQATCSESLDGLGEDPDPILTRPERGSREDRSLGGLVVGRGRDRLLIPEFAAAMQRISPEGVAFSACLTLPINDRDADIAATGVGTSLRTVSIEGERFRVLTEGYGNLGAVQFARDLELTEDTMNGLLVRIIAFGLVGAILAAMLGWFWAKRATLPVKQLSETAERVARTHDLGERIELDREDEIGTLATSLNSMLTSLDTSREQQQRLVQDASHELRTPLTSMRTNIELLQRHQNLDLDTQARVLADINTELAELTELAAELVESATEVSTTPGSLTPVVLSELVTECVERARRRHRREVGLELSVTDDPLAVHADPTLIARAVTNLINNATKFTDDSTDIDVVVTNSSVVVNDRGPGIPDQDLPHIFERFYRATAARSAPGSGLGLAIVKQIVDGHGGEVTAINRDGGGASIGFVLPSGESPSTQPD